MNIDKENRDVIYEDASHKYLTKNTLQECISVTTLIHKFTTFDSDFWASYKALEKISPRFHEFKMWLLDTKTFKESLLDEWSIDKDIFLITKQQVIEEWNNKSRESCIRGTKLHKELESGNLVGDIKELSYLKLGGKFLPNTTNTIQLGTQAIYPEILLSHITKDSSFRLAGQADLVIVDNNEIHVVDYKSSSKIDMESFYDRKEKKNVMMKFPLNNLMDSNYWQYSLQLSTYAWIIEKNNPDAIIKSLTIAHYDHADNINYYPCNYLKNDVERMLLYYKKELEHDKFKASRNKIVF